MIRPPMITTATAKYVLRQMFKTGKSADEIIKEEKLWSIEFLEWLRNVKS